MRFQGKEGGGNFWKGRKLKKRKQKETKKIKTEQPKKHTNFCSAEVAQNLTIGWSPG